MVLAWFPTFFEPPQEQALEPPAEPTALEPLLGPVPEFDSKVSFAIEDLLACYWGRRNLK